MASAAKRFTLTVPVDMAEKAEALKKNLFYDKPYAEMYRQLIQLGMDEIQKKGTKESRGERAS